MTQKCAGEWTEVGQAPWPAADALVGLGIEHTHQADQGSGADEGVCPTSS
jgi:hypothetical protein